MQVLENHEHVRALQGESQSESAAINLKLKEKAKGVWTKSFGVGLGYDDNVLWNCEANLMYFGKERQHVIFYGNDNTGSGVDRAVQHYDRHGLGTIVLTDILNAGNSPVGITLRNNAHTLNLSNLNKLSETKQLRYNLTYNHDIQRRSSYQQTPITCQVTMYASSQKTSPRAEPLMMPTSTSPTRTMPMPDS